MSSERPFPSAFLQSGMRSRIVPDVNGLGFHVLEAGWEGSAHPVVLLLHGFPELAFSWRHVMGLMADAGYHVIAPDQRGYGRTSPQPIPFEDDPAPFSILNLVRDMVALASALGTGPISSVVGHDYGASVAAACALVRPDLFRSLVIMSAPFLGAPTWPLPPPRTHDPITAELAALNPPRKHYQAYFATLRANEDMWRCPQGVHAFLRAYFHNKSGDWAGNKPFSLSSWSAAELAKMPAYYVMPLERDMPASVASEMPSEAEIAPCTWLNETELSFYSSEFDRTGFQGGLQWYRTRMDGSLAHDLALFAGRTIDCPALFLAGDRDWGPYQVPGALKRMRTAFTTMGEPVFVAGAGHWVQQERPAATASAIIAFLRAVDRPSG